jgi:hypothetical protein
VNHERIAEGLAEALCTISEDIAECEIELSMFQDENMKKLVADFYAHVFLLLSGIMDWIMRKRHKRLMDSFNETFGKRFDDEVAVIKKKAEKIRHLAEQNARAELRSTRLSVEDLGRDVRIGLEGEARHHAQMAYYAQRFERELEEARKERDEIRQERQMLAASVRQLLQESSMAHLGTQRLMVNQQVQGLLRSRPTTPIYGSESLFGMLFIYRKGTNDLTFPLSRATKSLSWYAQFANLSKAMEQTAEQVKVNSKDLENFFHRDRVRLSRIPSTPVMVNPDALWRVHSWTIDDSPRLWLDGPYADCDDFENPMTMVAAAILDLVENNRLPLISYFCTLSRAEPRPGNTREVEATLGMVYAVIRQMVELLLPSFESAIDLSESRFKLLDGTAKSWEDALQVFSDLLELMPKGVYVVLDGLHWLEDQSAESFLRAWIRTLKNSKLKVLFTSSGRSAVLRDELSDDEAFLIEDMASPDALFPLSRRHVWGGPSGD